MPRLIPIVTLILLLCIPIITVANPLLPPRRTIATPTQAEREAGFQRWTVPVGAAFFENIPPRRGDIIATPSCTISAGERTSVILGFYALKEGGCIRLFPKDKAPLAIEVRRVLFQSRVVPPVKGGRRLGIPFYLPRAQEAQLRKGWNSVYWLTVHAPKGTAPGEYPVALQLGRQEMDRTFSYNAGDNALARHRYANRYETIILKVRVLDYRLPLSKRAFGVYTVGGRRPDWAWTVDYQRKVAEDIAQHGHNSNTTGSWVKDTGFHVTGKVRIKGSELERRILLEMKAGLLKPDIPFLYFGGSAADCGKFSYAEYARQLAAGFKARGWPEPIFYGPDEPGPKIMAKVGADVNAVRPHVRTGTALKRWLPGTGPYFDVWIINSRCLDAKTKLAAKVQGAEIWTYDYMHRGTNARWHRFYAGVYTWAHNLRGNYLWAYTHTPSASWEGERTDHRGLVSPSRGGPVAMVGWAARREGIRDARTLTHLEAILSSSTHKQAGEARKWLYGLRKGVPERICVNEAGGLALQHSPYWWDMTDLLDPWPGKPSGAEIRAKAEAYIEALGRE